MWTADVESIAAKQSNPSFSLRETSGKLPRKGIQSAHRPGHMHQLLLCQQPDSATRFVGLEKGLSGQVTNSPEIPSSTKRLASFFAAWAKGQRGRCHRGCRSTPFPGFPPSHAITCLCRTGQCRCAPSARLIKPHATFAHPSCRCAEHGAGMAGNDVTSALREADGPAMGAHSSVADHCCRAGLAVPTAMTAPVASV